MKAKNIFALLGLSFVMGLGAAAFATYSTVNETSADGTTLYCKMNYDWWKADGAAVGAHYWGGTDGSSWPGVRMSRVATDTDVWKITIPSDHTSIIFTRVNGAGDIAYWNAKTGDLDIPTDGKNLYTITSESAVWGNPGVSGSWSTYVEPSPASMQYYYKVNDGEWVGPMSYNGSVDGGTGNDYVAGGLTLDANDRIYFRKGASDAIEPGASISREAAGGANNLMWSSSSHEIRVITDCSSKQLHLYAYGDGGYDSFLGGYVSDNHTYYFTNNYDWVGTPKVYALDAFENQREAWPGVDMTFVDVDGYEQSRYSFTLDTNRWTTFVINGGGEQTVDLSVSDFVGDYNAVFLNGGDETHRTVGYYTFTPAIYSLQVGGSSITLDLHEGTQYVAEDVDLTAGATVGYSYDGVVAAATAKGSSNNNISFGMKVINTADDVDVYVDVSAKTIWADGLPSLDNGFHLYHGTTIVPLVYDEGSEQYQSTNISFAVNDELRFIHVFDDHAPDIFGTATPGGDLAANFSYDGEKGCIVCVAACNAGVYFKPGDPNYAYFGIVDTSLVDATNFASGFNSAIGGVCVADGSTNKESLWTAWAAQKTAASSLSAAAKLILQTADSHHDVEAIANFAAKYDYVATKYGNFFNGKDSGYNFINRSITPISSYNGVFFGEMTSSSMISIVSVITFVSISAICVLVIYKKKRHN